LDIETSPNTAYVWGLFKTNIAPSQIKQTGRVMCWAAQWFSDDNSDVMFEAEWPRRHKTMVRRAWNLLDEADVVVHYNGMRFDIPTLNREFVKYEMGPPSPYQQVDLLRVAKKQFRFVSNKLTHLLQELDIGDKIKTEFELWIGCMEGDPQAQKDMEAYNRNDVTELQGLYDRLLPWISTHPNHALYEDSLHPVCPNCGSYELNRRGFAYTKTQKYRRFQCKACGTWSRQRSTAVDKYIRNNILTQAQ
jgi:hypothetical protein